MNFKRWFEQLTGHTSPRAWQQNLAEDATPRSRLIRRVTGDGKTEGVLSAWLWNALIQPEDNAQVAWPKRLVWCLPMRVLVEQTVATAKHLAGKIPEDQRPGVAVLMGGEDMEEYFLEPHRPWILVGTQDMLLSRAMNRGYASRRARWPIEFGLLNQDALWVMDEVQLMDVGLATSAQLQAYRDQDAAKTLKPACTWWMSATLQPDWLRSIDTEKQCDAWEAHPCVAAPNERQGGLWDISKLISTEKIGLKDHKTLAERILALHEQADVSDYGRITLVVCNTVDRAAATWEAIRKAGRTDNLELVHGRFRQKERESWRDNFLRRSACTKDTDRIIVATQVVEAGVDISAACLVTELAPWPSLVQRFGRCARYGGVGKVVVVDRFIPPEDKKKNQDRDEKNAAPYAPEELTSALSAVESLDDVGIRSLEEFEEQMDQEMLSDLYPYEPAHLLMRNEFDELFDTTPDLTGADLDISRFIRSGVERDIQVFWDDLGEKEAPDPKRRPQRRELCSVPFLAARDWLCGKETQSNKKPNLLKRMCAWVWDWLDGEWKVLRRENVVPGRIVCVAAHCGGYTPERGFSPESRETVLPAQEVVVAPSKEQLDTADNQYDGEAMSISEWKSIALHTQEVVEEVTKLASLMHLPSPLKKVLLLAARWHDIGKSHPAFQGALKDTEEEPRPDAVDLAKGPQSAWRHGQTMYQFATGDGDKKEIRRSFRHELAGALALFSVLQTYKPDHPALLGPWRDVLKALGHSLPSSTNAGPPTPEIQAVLDCTAHEFDLLVYLVASHHGKVRVALHASPADQDYPLTVDDPLGLPIRGIRKGDRLPSVAITPEGPLQPQLELSLEPAALGLSPLTGASWRERVQGLLQQYGPATLATLEAILRAADVNASRKQTEDPAYLKTEDRITMHIHKLKGCSPAPLAMYLKGLGILRIVAEQADAEARGWWQDEQFWLMTKLSREQLEEFFLNGYSPTPFLSPWNKGCGFFKANDPGLIPLEESIAPRFTTFREGISACRKLLDDISRADAAIRAIKDRTKTNKSFQSEQQREELRESSAYRQTRKTIMDALGDDRHTTAEERSDLEQQLATIDRMISSADKPPTKSQAEKLKKEEGYKRLLREAEKRFKAKKEVLVPDCRRVWRGKVAGWMKVAVILDENNEPKYPSLLGSGGNDGNFDFTNNAMQRLGELFDLADEHGKPQPATEELLRESFWSESSRQLGKNSPGQFLPGGGGGPNSDNGADGSPLINPWNFVLMMEGTIPFSARVTRRMSSNAFVSSSAPFVVNSHPAGHASPGNEKDIRGEQWLPIWSSPATFGDITALLGDARMQLKREIVRRPIDAARSVSRLGVARGIQSFIRYSFLERNGQATLAVPLGRIHVRENPRSHLIDDIANWMNRLQRLARDTHAPARLVHAERRLADAVFAALTHDNTCERWRLVLESAVDVEAIQVRGIAYTAGPIPKLKCAWVETIYPPDPNSSEAREVRLALSLAGAYSSNPFRSVRHHFLPLQDNGRQYKTSDKRLADDPRVVANGRDPVSDLVAIVLRRFIDAKQEGSKRLPLHPAMHCGSRLPDLAALIDGHVDLQRVLKLARALMALDWWQWNKSEYQNCAPRVHRSKVDEHPEEAWLAIRLASLQGPFKRNATEFDIPAEHSMVRRLAAGDGGAAVEIAERRLTASGLHPPFSAAFTDEQTAKLWAAALAFPITRQTAAEAANILIPETT